MRSDERRKEISMILNGADDVSIEEKRSLLTDLVKALKLHRTFAIYFGHFYGCPDISEMPDDLLDEGFRFANTLSSGTVDESTRKNILAKVIESARIEVIAARYLEMYTGLREVSAMSKGPLNDASEFLAAITADGAGIEVQRQVLKETIRTTKTDDLCVLFFKDNFGTTDIDQFTGVQCMRSILHIRSLLPMIPSEDASDEMQPSEEEEGGVGSPRCA